MYRRLLPLLLLLAAVAGVAADPDADPAEKPEARVWRARWVWTSGEPAPRNSYTYFRKVVDLESTPREAKIHLTADSRYQLFVNGKLAGRGPVRSDRRWLYYDTWDVTGHLRKGKNVLAVLVHHYGESTFSYMQGRGGLLAELLGNGGRSLAYTDASWRALRSTAWEADRPRMSIQLGFNEVFDARREPSGWKDAGFNDTDWPAAEEIGPAGMEPWPNLVPRDIPPMHEEPVLPKRLLEVAEVDSLDGVQHVDLLPLMEPKNWGAAYLTTTLVSPDRREVELRFGSDDALKVWVNGREVVSHLIDRAAAPDQETARITLRAGENRVLAKVVQGHTGWEFYFRLDGGQGVKQVGPKPGDGALWSVVGPFPYPQASGLKAGFETVYAPEQNTEVSATYTLPDGKQLTWRPAAAGSGARIEVSRQMAMERRYPLRTATVTAQDQAIQVADKGAVIKTAPGRDVSLLIDFGREVTGYPRFRVRGARGGEVVDMGYGEVLHDEKGGFLPQSGEEVGRLNPDRDGVHYADRYVCRAGTQEFQTFDKRGFRYLQLDVRNAPEGIELDGVGLVFSTYPVEFRGAFQCSDERLNRIWEIGRYTCQLNMEDAYTDCPWRERGQWWGDARVEALINYYCFGDTKLIRKALRQKGQSLNEEGMTWGIYPTDWDGGRLPSFTLIWVSSLWDTYLHTGDREIVEELFPKVRYTLDRFFGPRVSAEGLLKDIPYWVFIDWAPVDTAGQGGALNAYYYDALRSAARMARLLEDPSAAEYDRRAGEVRRAMNTHLWDPKLRVYRDSILPDGKLSAKVSQQTNSLCVMFEIAPRQEWPAILDYIYAPANAEKVVQAGSPYFSYYLLGGLFGAGRQEQAVEYIRKQWGRMLDWGATTWWENWQPGASFCHGWSGGPTYNLPAEIVGVKPLQPGFKEVLVEPHWVGLRYATATVPTVSGPVKVGWQRDERSGAAALRVQTEKGIPFEVVLPGSGEITVNKKKRLGSDVEVRDSVTGTRRFRVEKGGSALFELTGAK